MTLILGTASGLLLALFGGLGMVHAFNGRRPLFDRVQMHALTIGFVLGAGACASDPGPPWSVPWVLIYAAAAAFVAHEAGTRTAPVVGVRVIPAQPERNPREDMRAALLDAGWSYIGGFFGNDQWYQPGRHPETSAEAALRPGMNLDSAWVTHRRNTGATPAQPDCADPEQSAQ